MATKKLLPQSIIISLKSVKKSLQMSILAISTVSIVACGQNSPSKTDSKELKSNQTASVKNDDTNTPMPSIRKHKQALPQPEDNNTPDVPSDTTNPGGITATIAPKSNQTDNYQNITAPNQLKGGLIYSGYQNTTAPNQPKGGLIYSGYQNITAPNQPKGGLIYSGYQNITAPNISRGFIYANIPNQIHIAGHGEQPKIEPDIRNYIPTAMTKAPVVVPPIVWGNETPTLIALLDTHEHNTYDDSRRVIRPVNGQCPTNYVPVDDRETIGLPDSPPQDIICKKIITNYPPSDVGFGTDTNVGNDSPQVIRPINGQCPTNYVPVDDRETIGLPDSPPQDIICKKIITVYAPGVTTDVVAVKVDDIPANIGDSFNNQNITVPDTQVHNIYDDGRRVIRPVNGQCPKDYVPVDDRETIGLPDSPPQDIICKKIITVYASGVTTDVIAVKVDSIPVDNRDSFGVQEPTQGQQQVDSNANNSNQSNITEFKQASVDVVNSIIKAIDEVALNDTDNSSINGTLTGQSQQIENKSAIIAPPAVAVVEPPKPQYNVPVPVLRNETPALLQGVGIDFSGLKADTNSSSDSHFKIVYAPEVKTDDNNAEDKPEPQGQPIKSLVINVESFYPGLKYYSCAVAHFYTDEKQLVFTRISPNENENIQSFYSYGILNLSEELLSSMNETNGTLTTGDTIYPGDAIDIWCKRDDIINSTFYVARENSLEPENALPKHALNMYLHGVAGIVSNNGTVGYANLTLHYDKDYIPPGSFSVNSQHYIKNNYIKKITKLKVYIKSIPEPFIDNTGVICAMGASAKLKISPFVHGHPYSYGDYDAEPIGYYISTKTVPQIWELNVMQVAQNLKSGDTIAVACSKYINGTYRYIYGVTEPITTKIQGLDLLGYSNISFTETKPEHFVNHISGGSTLSSIKVDLTNISINSVCSASMVAPKLCTSKYDCNGFSNMTGMTDLETELVNNESVRVPVQLGATSNHFTAIFTNVSSYDDGVGNYYASIINNMANSLDIACLDESTGLIHHTKNELHLTPVNVHIDKKTADANATLDYVDEASNFTFSKY